MSEWIYANVLPWVPQTVENADLLGHNTEFPANTGFAPTWDLYWKPKLLIVTFNYEFISVGGGSTGYLGTQRCTRALQLGIPPGKPAIATFSEEVIGANIINLTFAIYPESRQVRDTTEHYLKMTCTGYFQVSSDQDHFTTADFGEEVGNVSITANPGVPSVFTFPIVRKGPGTQIASLNVLVSRQDWLESEL